MERRVISYQGWDFKTKGKYKWKQSYGDLVKVERTDLEKNGRIPLVASFAGVITPKLYDDKQGLGWGIYLTADTEIEEGKTVQYRAIYWHIESLWSKLGSFTGSIKKILRRERVRSGAIIAVGGNNGKSTGPHLHFGIQKRTLLNGSWTKWEYQNPRGLMTDILYSK